MNGFVQFFGPKSPGRVSDNMTAGALQIRFMVALRWVSASRGLIGQHVLDSRYGTIAGRQLVVELPAATMVKRGGRLINHSRCHWLLLRVSHFRPFQRPGSLGIEERRVKRRWRKTRERERAPLETVGCYNSLRPGSRSGNPGQGQKTWGHPGRALRYQARSATGRNAHDPTL